MGSGELTDFVVVVIKAMSLEDVDMGLRRWAISCEQVSGSVVLKRFLQKVLLSIQHGCIYFYVSLDRLKKMVRPLGC